MWESVNVTNTGLIDVSNLASFLTMPVNYNPIVVLLLSILSVVLIIIGFLYLNLRKPTDLFKG